MHNILSFLSLNFYLYYIFILEFFFSCINLLTTILMSLDCFAAVFACVSVPLSERPSVCLCACSDVSFVPLFQPVNGSTSTMESYESLPQSEDQVKLLQTKKYKDQTIQDKFSLVSLVRTLDSIRNYSFILSLSVLNLLEINALLIRPFHRLAGFNRIF